MNRTEKLELLIEIDGAIQHFKERIDLAEWSNAFGMGLETQYRYLRYVHRQIK